MSNTAYTITEASLEQEFANKLSAGDMQNLHRAYTAGMQFVFSPQTHGQVIQQFERDLKTHPDSAGVLGADVAHLMIYLINESKGTMPQQIIGPCAILLMAKACEFISKANIIPITDQTFAAAVKVMVTALSAAMNPQFRQKVGAPNPAQSAPQPSGGLLQPQGGA